jgi:hypothetical protein
MSAGGINIWAVSAGSINILWDLPFESNLGYFVYLYTADTAYILIPPADRANILILTADTCHILIITADTCHILIL